MTVSVNQDMKGMEKFVVEVSQSYCTAYVILISPHKCVRAILISLSLSVGMTYA